MSIFKALKKKVTINKFNRSIMDAALYQLMLRYFDVEYGFGGNDDWKVNRFKSCDLLTVATSEDKVAIKYNYDKFPEEDLCLAEFCKVMTDLTEYIFKFVLGEYSNDPFESIISDEMRESYVSEQIHGICANIYNMSKVYPNLIIVKDLRQNWQVHNILMDGYRSGLDLHSSVIFHENELYMNESNYNVRDLSLNSAFALNEIKTVLMVYSGLVFNPRERTAPLFPMMEYIIARSYYGRYKIGESVGFEENCKLYIARARHAEKAHEFCVDFLQKYHDNRDELENELAVLQNDEDYHLGDKSEVEDND